MAKSKGVKPLVQNRRARHEYFVEETYECGMELKGTEVKSIRKGRANLQESYARVRNGEVFVDGMHISPYEQGNVDIAALGQAVHGGLQFVKIHGQPLGQDAGTAFTHGLEQVDVAAGSANRDHVTLLNDIGGDVHTLAVDQEVAMVDQLAGLGAGSSHACAVHHVIQPALQKLEQVFAGNPLHGGGAVIGAFKLRFKNAISTARLLLLTKLRAILTHFTLTGLAMLAGRCGPFAYRAFLGEALFTLEEELGALATALTAS